MTIGPELYNDLENKDRNISNQDRHAQALEQIGRIAPSVLLNPIKHHLEDLRAAQSVALGALGNRQTRGASQSLPPSFHAPANHPFKSISPDSTSKNWWIGS